MQLRLVSRAGPVLLLLAPMLAITAGRFATHSELAAGNPRTAALLFLWLCADALALALIAKAPANKPGLRALLGALAAGCIVATLAAATPVREAILSMDAAVAAMALTLAAYLGWSMVLALRRWRATRSLEQVLGEILPARLATFAMHESAMMRLALFSWGTAPDVPPGAKAFAYHRVVNPMIAAFLVLQLIEIFAVHLLVSHWSERAALVLLALGIWGALFLVALTKAFRLKPILIDRAGVRVRSGTIIDVYLPFDAIEGIGGAISDAETKRGDVLSAAILSHPNIVLTLARPLEHTGFLGRKRMIRRVAFRLDQPAPFFEALEHRI